MAGYQIKTTRTGHTRRAEDDKLFAAVDWGANNCRLLIVKPFGQLFRVVDSFSRIVRLGTGLEAHGRLSNTAMDRAVAAFKICARKIERHHPPPYARRTNLRHRRLSSYQTSQVGER